MTAVKCGGRLSAVQSIISGDPKAQALAEAQWETTSEPMRNVQVSSSPLHRRSRKCGYQIGSFVRRRFTYAKSVETQVPDAERKQVVLLYPCLTSHTP